MRCRRMDDGTGDGTRTGKDGRKEVRRKGRRRTGPMTMMMMKGWKWRERRKITLTNPRIPRGVSGYRICQNWDVDED